MDTISSDLWWFMDRPFKKVSEQKVSYSRVVKGCLPAAILCFTCFEIHFFPNVSHAMSSFCKVSIIECTIGLWASLGLYTVLSSFYSPFKDCFHLSLCPKRGWQRHSKFFLNGFHAPLNHIVLLLLLLSEELAGCRPQLLTPEVLITSPQVAGVCALKICVQRVTKMDCKKWEAVHRFWTCSIGQAFKQLKL